MCKNRPNINYYSFSNLFNQFLAQGLYIYGMEIQKILYHTLLHILNNILYQQIKKVLKSLGITHFFINSTAVYFTKKYASVV